MNSNARYDYFYGMEAEQFAFYRIPKELVKEEFYKTLSCEAKFLYGLLLDRLSLSVKKGWFDENNRAYIYYKVESIMEDLGCSKSTCTKILAELDTKKGIGLIERKHQGLGMPDIIYVKNFTTLNVEKRKNSTVKEENVQGDNSASSKGINYKPQEVQKIGHQRSDNANSRGINYKPQEVQKTDHQRSDNADARVSKIIPSTALKSSSNYLEESYTESSDTESINLSGFEKKESGMDEMDVLRNAYITLIQENVDYENVMSSDDYTDGAKEMYQELVTLICDVVCAGGGTVRIGKQDYPHEVVKSRFLKLNSEHIDYVIDSMKKTNTEIVNIRAYMLTALYHAPATFKHYIQQKVQHDMYGGGWEEEGFGHND